MKTLSFSDASIALPPCAFISPEEFVFFLKNVLSRLVSRTLLLPRAKSRPNGFPVVDSYS